ncbi:MAG: UDP-N-acetylglucosamine--N-acetylmuramyl-(pentapeptide) pyrophosphoryl-undecaprenol N-acetylglucosamine transferase [Candidatus Omnitrophota bacterium]|nr:UDP-N-acetylglucosamine--N-acetylmuramyl-(pentapeptide) pyrophosphoryl-undecaprenol N-acetylglucosamine transferase [Candidatus Omnitrophota bacterium]
MKIILACDRSAGHIFPALTVGKNIRNKSAIETNSLDGRKSISYKDEVYFFATSDFLKDYLEKEGFLVYGKIFRSRNLLKEVVFRALEAIYLIFKLKPRKIIGFGGRDSFFLLFFGSLLFLDTAIYEPNRTIGKANKVLSFFVHKVFCGFQETVIIKKAKVVGIPLRENIKIIPRAKALEILHFEDKPVIFCFGGSQGSSFLNSIFVKLVTSLDGDYQVVHLTGRREYFQIMQFYNKIKRRVFVKDFYYAMEVLYSATDLAICRAGASTLAELTYYGIPSILIPHPAASGHQKENAFYLAKRGAAFVFLQEKFSFNVFMGTVEKAIYDGIIRQSLMRNLGNIKLGVNYKEFCANTYF